MDSVAEHRNAQSTSTTEMKVAERENRWQMARDSEQTKRGGGREEGNSTVRWPAVYV